MHRDLKIFIKLSITMALLLALILTMTRMFMDFNTYKEVDVFKDDTAIIEGRVTDSREDIYLIFSNRYYLLVTTKEDNSKIIEVTESQFKDYQKGTKVKFRYYTESKNRIAIDLTNQKDVKTNKDLESFYKNYKIERWSIPRLY